jgi:hypothetical protein
MFNCLGAGVFSALRPPSLFFSPLCRVWYDYLKGAGSASKPAVPPSFSHLFNFLNSSQFSEPANGGGREGSPNQTFLVCE